MGEELCYYSTGLELKTYFRARKVSGPFDKRAPGPDLFQTKLVKRR